MITEYFKSVFEKDKRKEVLIFEDNVKSIFSNFDRKSNLWYIQYIKGVLK